MYLNDLTCHQNNIVKQFPDGGLVDFIRGEFRLEQLVQGQDVGLFEHAKTASNRKNFHGDLLLAQILCLRRGHFGDNGFHQSLDLFFDSGHRQGALLGLKPRTGQSLSQFLK